MVRNKSSQAGFSLAELLVAIMILAVGLLGLAEMQIAAMHDNTISAATIETSSLAQSALEEVMAVGKIGDELYPVIQTAQTGQPWPDTANDLLNVVDTNGTVVTKNGGRYRVSYDTSIDPPGVCGGSTPGNHQRMAVVTVYVESVIGSGGRYGRSKTQYSVIKNCQF